MNTWVGSTKEQVLKGWGKPHVTVPTKDGGETWTYIETYQNTTDSRTFTFSAEGKVVSWDRA